MITIHHFLSAMLSVVVLVASFTSSVLITRPDSASDVATKLHVLNELGIEFSEETGRLIEQSIEETKSMFVDLGFDGSQLSSYPIILSRLGTGYYDKEAQCLIPLTNSVYAFDAECYDIAGAYEDFLLSVARISNGEIRIDECHSDVSEATFEAGIGTQEVTFSLNGISCNFTAQFYYDWMDCTIIDYVNQILDEQGIGKSLWCMYDGGQGAIVFYNTAEWAQVFMERTGYPLAVKANEAR